MAKDKYKQIEELLYSYKELPFRKKILELNLKLEEDPNKRAELKRIETNIAKIDNMLDMIKLNSELDYLIIKLRYIDRLEWSEIEGQLSMKHDKIKVSYTNIDDMPRILEALKGFKILRISKARDKKNYKNVYLELE